MKEILANYLPQYHQNVENDLWWGKNFTEWNLVKNAKPLFKNHKQPYVPLNNNYYDLANGLYIGNQYKLANSYGITGFNIYLYWSNGKMLLQRPLFSILNNTEINFRFVLTWANHPWTRTWQNRKGASEILFYQNYEKTKSEFLNFAKHLKAIFNDSRYIKINGKPLFIIYKVADLPKNYLKYLTQTFRELGIEIYLAIMIKDISDLIYTDDADLVIPFNPTYSLFSDTGHNLNLYLKNKTRQFIIKKIPTVADICMKYLIKEKPKIYNFKDISCEIVNKYEKLISVSDRLFAPMACCGFDNTPRYKNRSTIFTDFNCSDFENQVHRLCEISSTKYGDKKLLFVNAWNEWGEGMFLEPDQLFKYQKLKSLKTALS